MENNNTEQVQEPKRAKPPKEPWDTFNPLFEKGSQLHEQLIAVIKKSDGTKVKHEG